MASWRKGAAWMLQFGMDRMLIFRVVSRSAKVNQPWKIFLQVRNPPRRGKRLITARSSVPGNMGTGNSTGSAPSNWYTHVSSQYFACGTKGIRKDHIGQRAMAVNNSAVTWPVKREKCLFFFHLIFPLSQIQRS